MNRFAVDGSKWRSPWRAGGAASCWTLAHKIGLGLALAFLSQCALAQAMYRIKPLGFLSGCTTSFPSAFGFNAADEITGRACGSDGENHAFLWKNNGKPMVNIGSSEAGSYSTGYGINASGMVVGFASDSSGEYDFVTLGDGQPVKKIYDGLGGTGMYDGAAINDLGQVTGGAFVTGDTAVHAFLWKNDGSPMIDLGSLGGATAYGRAINNSGQVLGSSLTSGNMYYHAFVWNNDGSPLLDLGTLGGYSTLGIAINASGQVAGTSYTFQGTKPHAFFWRNDGTPMQDLGALGSQSSYGGSLNNAGQIASTSYTKGKIEHAYVWLNDGMPMQDLGTFGGSNSYGSSINSSGQVTGQAYLSGNVVAHAFLWRNDGTKIQDLNTLIDPTDPLKHYVTLTDGGIINDLGDIVAYGTDSRNGLEGTYLLQGTMLTLTPRSLAFGNQPINSSSAAKSVTVTNTSSKAVAVSSIALTGTAAGQFAQTNTCGKSLAGHAICTIKVTFKPTTKGAKSEVLNVNGGGGGLRSVALTGKGT